MRKIIVYIATSADGFIARPDGNVDWLNRPRTAPGMPDDLFRRQVHALREELVVLKALLEGRPVELAPSCAPVV